MQIENAKAEIEFVKKYEALATLAKPQPTTSGKSLLSGMNLKLVTGFHLCLSGEAFWMLDKRQKINVAPTLIDLFLPQYGYRQH